MNKGLGSSGWSSLLLETLNVKQAATTLTELSIILIEGSPILVIPLFQSLVLGILQLATGAFDFKKIQLNRGENAKEPRVKLFVSKGTPCQRQTCF